MKTTIVLGAAVALGCISNAQAILISGTDVGAVDTFKCSQNSTNSGQSYEEDFVKTCTGKTVTLANNIGITDAGLLSEGIYSAINVTPNAPGYFLLKFGTGNTGNDMLVFENLADLNYLVWTDDQLAAALVPSNHVNSISHYTFGGTTTTTTVPEPATLSLLGLGLLGLGAARRRRSATGGQ